MGGIRQLGTFILISSSLLRAISLTQSCFVYLRFVYSQDNQYPYYNASTVPPEWHGWLSHVDDEPGLTTRPVPPNAIKFIAGGHTTGVQGEMYQPKGSFYNKRGMRNWKRYMPWSPP